MASWSGPVGNPESRAVRVLRHHADRSGPGAGHRSARCESGPRRLHPRRGRAAAGRPASRSGDRRVSLRSLRGSPQAPQEPGRAPRRHGAGLSPGRGAPGARGDPLRLHGGAAAPGRVPGDPPARRLHGAPGRLPARGALPRSFGGGARLLRGGLRAAPGGSHEHARPGGGLRSPRLARGLRRGRALRGSPVAVLDRRGADRGARAPERRRRASGSRLAPRGSALLGRAGPPLRRLLRKRGEHMKVVHVYKDYEPPVFGGIEHTVRLLSEGIAARSGADVTVVCSSLSSRTSVDQAGAVRVVRAATFGRIARAPVSPTLMFWLRRLQPDILHFHHPNPTGELACLLARPRCPVVLTYHCDIVRQKRLLKLYRHPLRRFLARADHILVTSPAALEGNPFLDPHRARCEVLPLGIRASDLEETERTREVAAALRRARPGPNILFVGRMRPYKGIPVLIDAIAHTPGTLVLVGQGESEEEIRHKVRREGLSDRVVFTGDVPQSDLRGYYQAADLFVLPSLDRSEAFGLAMVEAMHTGLPVISTRVGTGTSHVNLDGITGLEVPPGDAASLASAIRWILEHPDEAKRMGEAGRERSLLFTHAAMVDRTATLYQELLRQNGAPAHARRAATRTR